MVTHVGGHFRWRHRSAVAHEMPSLIKRCNGKNRGFKFPPVTRWIRFCFSTGQGVNSWLPFVIYLMLCVVLPDYGKKRTKKRLAIILLVQILCPRGQHIELTIGSSSRVRAFSYLVVSWDKKICYTFLSHHLGLQMAMEVNLAMAFLLNPYI